MRNGVIQNLGVSEPQNFRDTEIPLFNKLSKLKKTEQ